MLIIFILSFILKICFSNELEIKVVGIRESKNCSDTKTNRSSDRYLKILSFSKPFKKDIDFKNTANEIIIINSDFIKNKFKLYNKDNDFNFNEKLEAILNEIRLNFISIYISELKEEKVRFEFIKIKIDENIKKLIILLKLTEEETSKLNKYFNYNIEVFKSHIKKLKEISLLLYFIKFNQEDELKSLYENLLESFITMFDNENKELAIYELETYLNKNIDSYLKENTFVKIQACRENNNFIYNCNSLPRITLNNNNSYYKLNTLIDSVQKNIKYQELSKLSHSISKSAQKIALFIIGGKVFTRFYTSSLANPSTFSSIKSSISYLVGGITFSSIPDLIYNNDEKNLYNNSNDTNIKNLCIKSSKKLDKSKAISILSNFYIFSGLLRTNIFIDSETIIKLDDYIDFLDNELLYLINYNKIQQSLKFISN